MESEGTPEHSFSSPEINEASEDREINDLPERLGFIETTELSLLKAAAIEAYLAGQQEQAEELRSHYQLVAEQLVNQLQGEPYADAQIGLIVALGNLRRDSGKAEAYVHDLDDAMMYAENMGYEEVVSVLETAKSQVETARTPSQEISDVLMNLGDDYGFDAETCEEISEQPFEEAFQTAYGYLTQAGLDADEILAEFTEN